MPTNTLTVNSSTVAVSATLANSDVLVPASVPITVSQAIAFGSGTGAGNVDLCHSKQYTIAFGANQDLDLTALTDSLGAAVNFARVKSVKVFLTTATAPVSVTLGNAGANPWLGFFDATTDTIKLRGGAKGSQFALECSDATGWVTAGGSKVFRIHNDDGAIAATVNVVILGCSV